MQVQLIRQFGSADVFEAATLPLPAPGPGQVRVRQVATSINPVDYKIRHYGPPIAPALPAVLGCDIAGHVDAIGEGVDGFAVGDAVYGCGGGVAGMGGAYAEYIVTDAALLAPAPRELPLREAAALPLVTITAWEGLDRAELQAGERILVLGGSGGVGHVAVQLAKARGAHVVATASEPAKAARLRELGADVVVDHRAEPVADYVQRLTDGRGFDVVFDATGGSDIGAAFAAAGLNGRVVTIVAGYTADLTPMHIKGLSLHAVFMLIPMLHGIGRARHGEIMRAAAALVDAGRLRPIVDAQRYALNDIAAAHARLEAGGVSGKIVVDIADATTLTN